MNQLIENYKNWKLKNTFFLLVSVVFLFYFVDTPLAKNIIDSVKDLGYPGIFLTGVFFVSTFTVVPASIVLFYLAKEFNIFEVVLLAGLGSMVGDYIIFRFLKDKIFKELKPIFLQLGGSHVSKLFSTPYFAWFAPALGAIIIASPLPDEIGIGLLGVTKLKNWQFMILSFVLNSFGIFVIITLVNLL